MVGFRSRGEQPLVAMRDCVRIYQWLDIQEPTADFGNNYYVAWTMVMGAPFQQLRDGSVLWHVQVAMY